MAAAGDGYFVLSSSRSASLPSLAALAPRSLSPSSSSLWSSGRRTAHDVRPVLSRSRLPTCRNRNCLHRWPLSSASRVPARAQVTSAKHRAAPRRGPTAAPPLSSQLASPAARTIHLSAWRRGTWRCLSHSHSHPHSVGAMEAKEWTSKPYSARITERLRLSSAAAASGSTSASASPSPAAVTDPAAATTGGGGDGAASAGSGRTKHVWVWSENAAVVEEAARLGWPTVGAFASVGEADGNEAGHTCAIVDNSAVLVRAPATSSAQVQAASKWVQVGSYVRIISGTDQHTLYAAAADVARRAGGEGRIGGIDGEDVEESAVVLLEEGDGLQDGNGVAATGDKWWEPLVVMDAADWKVITAENAVAVVQNTLGVSVVGTVETAAQARSLLEALETGLSGVVLRSDKVEELRLLQEYINLAGLQTCVVRAKLGVSPTTTSSGVGASGSSSASSSDVTLVAARVTAVTQCGVGHRVCVDLCSLLPPGAGLLVGSFARGFFLVHSECLSSPYVPSRPFRVNAGPVHSYVALPGGRTAYLSELSSGSEVLVVDHHGKASVHTVGRAKVEIRPMVLVEAVPTSPSPADAAPLSVFLQHAETVRLVTPQQGTLGSSTSVETLSKSVMDLQVGDQVIVSVQDDVARHTGIAVKEFILEK